MPEERIDMAGEMPKILTGEAVHGSEVVVTMGCGDTCPIHPRQRYEGWALDDPAGPRRMETLIAEIAAA